MSDKVAELKTALSQEDPAAWISNMWQNWNNQRQPKMAEWQETKAYVFATDTRTTSNRNLPWHNSTTLPKLCQIRDNLHANYLSALFPNDKWLTWKAFDKESANKEVAKTITGYMDNKAREGGLRGVISRLLYDYIDYGNAFVMPAFELRYRDFNGERIKDYVGPVSVRISPEDIVFNPLATDITKTPKIVRSTKTIGELMKLAQTEPEMAFWEEAVQRRLAMRTQMHQFGIDDWAKSESYAIDGFGNLHEYYQSDYVEVLEFFGDWHDHDSGALALGRMITVVDRAVVIRDVEIPTYGGRDLIRHVGWRSRPDNLWSMGPLDNLVGLQYRLDHMQNLQADALDLTVHPPLKIIGNVEAFVWGPEEQILIDEEGDVQEVSKGVQGIAVSEQNMQIIEERMEMYAGAPKEAMGIRTPGEKTAFEVGQLMTAAGRIFQEKITAFEVELLEPHLNDMLEVAHRNFEENDVISVLDNDLGVEQFKTITKESIIANGKLRPIGARHFAQRSQELQELINIFNTGVVEFLKPHTSALNLTNYINDALDIRGYDIFKPNVGIQEQAETESLIAEANSQLQAQAGAPSPEDVEVPEDEGEPVQGI